MTTTMVTKHKCHRHFNNMAHFSNTKYLQGQTLNKRMKNYSSKATVLATNDSNNVKKSENINDLTQKPQPAATEQVMILGTNLRIP